MVRRAVKFLVPKGPKIALNSDTEHCKFSSDIFTTVSWILRFSNFGTHTGSDNHRFRNINMTSKCPKFQNFWLRLHSRSELGPLKWSLLAFEIIRIGLLSIWNSRTSGWFYTLVPNSVLLNRAYWLLKLFGWDFQLVVSSHSDSGSFEVNSERPYRLPSLET